MEAARVQSTDVLEPAGERVQRKLADILPEGPMLAAVIALGLFLLVASFAVFGASGRALVGAVLCPVLVLLAAIDLKHRLLPNVIVFPSIVAVLAIVAATNSQGFLEHLWAGLALGGFLLIFCLVFPAGLGMGDAKVGFLLGFALGWRTVSAMMIAFFGLFLAALWIISRQGLNARRQALPFGPFLAIGAIVAFFLT
jgi:leader peptidase (prepilin peptidase) / N-methyltransferase